jgi:hypothetical protein
VKSDAYVQHQSKQLGVWVTFQHLISTLLENLFYFFYLILLKDRYFFLPLIDNRTVDTAWTVVDAGS